MAAKVQIPELRSLRLDRLEGRLADVWDRRLGLVVAPAGSGKTTLIAGFVGAQDAPVAWYRAESWDARPRAFLRHLQTSVASATARRGVPGLGRRPWETVEAAASAFDGWPGRRLLVVVDDLHALEGTDAEATLERLIDYAPRSLAVIVATRSLPAFNLSRRRIEGTLLEITSDDLRFRSWEVERLFREVYGLSIPPQELAVLARRTEGWAAGLQLFRLAIQGKSADERRRLLAESGASARFLREYLARNVLAGLPDNLRAFLVATCVLGRLSGPLCDALLGRTGTAAVLDELERRQVFTTRADDGTYRYHEVLRTHLEAILVETNGEAATRDRFRRAGELLTAQEEIGDALAAFARAGDWAAVERLIGSRGQRLVNGRGPTAWLDALPPALIRNDPWLVLATARRSRDDGRWAAAAESFQQAERSFGSSEGAAIARRERQSIAIWLDPAPVHQREPLAVLRAAVARDPLAARQAAAGLDEPWRGMVGGLIELLAGRPLDARRQLANVAEHEAASRPLAAAALLAAAIAGLLAHDPAAVAELEVAGHEADLIGSTWLSRLARAGSLLAPDGIDRCDAAEFDRLREACAEAGDVWGEIAIRLIGGWAGLGEVDSGPAIATLEPAIELANRSGAGALEAWARALHAIASVRARRPDALDVVERAETVARMTASPGARAVASEARAIADPAAANNGAETAEAHGATAGLLLLRAPNPRSIAVAAPAIGSGRAIAVRCFGAFRIEVDGRPIDLRTIRPRPRSLLHLLAIHVGDALHREVLEAAIWPAGEADPGAARLHVAISTVRRLLRSDSGGPSSSLVIREGEAYLLALPDGSFVDIRAFEAAVAAARAAVGNDAAAAMTAAARAIELYTGDLLAEEGPAEWVVERRDHYRMTAIEAAEILASVALAESDPATAAGACLAGLGIERYHDPFWRLLIQAREMAGDHGAATRAEAEYHDVLAELGVATGSGEPRASRLAALRSTRPVSPSGPRSRAADGRALLRERGHRALAGRSRPDLEP